MTDPLKSLKDAIDSSAGWFWANVPKNVLVTVVEWMEGSKAKLAALEETQAELAKERQRAFDAEARLRGEREQIAAYLNGPVRRDYEYEPEAVSALQDAAIGIERGEHEKSD